VKTQKIKTGPRLAAVVNWVDTAVNRAFARIARKVFTKTPLVTFKTREEKQVVNYAKINTMGKQKSPTKN
jgi:hypothetical protein